ncbi:MAG TPA: KOW motif-containing protein [Amycolatopsis sp.]|nr:KOW motif-containing protein [Amycolatopsis sp.]
MSKTAPGDRVRVTGGPYEGRVGTVCQNQNVDSARWIALDGAPSAALVRPALLAPTGTLADHRAHTGPFCTCDWSFTEPGIRIDDACTRPGLVVLGDPSGSEAVVCRDHWRSALEVSGGARRALRLVASVAPGTPTR